MDLWCNDTTGLESVYWVPSQKWWKFGVV
jgi:hypothetical protein